MYLRIYFRIIRENSYAVIFMAEGIAAQAYLGTLAFWPPWSVSSFSAVFACAHLTAAHFAVFGHSWCSRLHDNIV